MKSKSLLPCIIAGAAGAIVATVLPSFLTTSKADTKLLPFQGRLTDAAGAAIADGAKVVEFKMYDAPTGGSVKWAGEVHKLSVNGGLVNTMLGSKASLGSVDFSTPCFLQLTVDADGDNQITAADPPLLPRQSVVPAVFASEAGNSRKLAGHDWSAILSGGLNNPSEGTLRGDKLADSSVPGGKIANGTITGTQLALNAVQQHNLAEGSVSLSKLAPRVVTMPAAPPNGAPAGAIASSGLFSKDWDADNPPGTVYTTIDESKIAIQATGRPMQLAIMGGVFRAEESVSGSKVAFDFVIKRKGNPDVTVQQAAGFNQDISGYFEAPVVLLALDVPPPGEQEYFIEIQYWTGGRRTYRLKNCQLIAYELQ